MMTDARKSGLTLVELVVVMVLLLFIGLAIAGLVRSVADAGQRIEQIGETSQIGRVVIQRMATELSSTLPLPVPNAEMLGAPLGATEMEFAAEAAPILSFYHEDSYDTRLGLDLDTLRFTTSVADPRRGEVPQADLLEVLYFVDTDPKTPEQGLVRSVGTLPGLLPEEATFEQQRQEVISNRVVSLNFRFYDPDTGEWLDLWELTDVLPLMVEVTVGVAPRECDEFWALSERQTELLKFVEFFTVTVPICVRSYPDPSVQIQRQTQQQPMLGGQQRPMFGGQQRPPMGETLSPPSSSRPPSLPAPSLPSPPIGGFPQGGGQR